MIRRGRALAVATAILVLAISVLGAVVFPARAQAHSSTVTVLDGDVLVRHASGDFLPLSDGDVVGAGDSVRTAADSHAVLTLFDGSTIELEPGTEVAITDLEASPSGDKIVELTQIAGTTWHVVTHLISSSSRYEIHATSLTAAVRGTAFAITIPPDGQSARLTTTDGDVATAAQGTEVHVLAGQFTEVTPGSAPEAPRPAPEPTRTVKITMELAPNAIVTDSKGRAVGVQNGQPVRYIPGSRVEVVDGKLVLTIPDVDEGTMTTTITPDSSHLAPTTVNVQTEVSTRDQGVVAKTLSSHPVRNGRAKGAIVISESGVLLLPDSDAQNAPAPHIGARPKAPSGAAPVGPSLPVVTLPPHGPALVPTERPLDLTRGLYVPFQRLGAPSIVPGAAPSIPVNRGVEPLRTPLPPLFKPAATPSLPHPSVQPPPSAVEPRSTDAPTLRLDPSTPIAASPRPSAPTLAPTEPRLTVPPTVSTEPLPALLPVPPPSAPVTPIETRAASPIVVPQPLPVASALPAATASPQTTAAAPTVIQPTTATH